VEGHPRRHRRYRLVRAGLLAGADAAVGRHVAAVPAHQKGSETLWKLYEKFPSVQKEFNEIQPLVLYTSSPNLLVSKKQVRTLEDFKGLKLRVLGGPPTEMAKALGAVPTLIPMPDVYQSLDKGVVDGAAAP
jgi:TRAP-type C4-dicarboxylate transport system substrate-binding protein